MSKIGLVVEGGGMKCVYSAGILDRFLDDKVSFDYAVGVSAGSANVVSFLGGQRDRNRRFYTDHLYDKEYLGLWPWIHDGQIFGLQYIYETLSNSTGKDPVNYPGVINNPTQFEIVATDMASGKAHYFDKSEMAQDDYRIIQASCSLPLFCRPITIDGHTYHDGGVADSIPIQRALDQGCDKVVVITSKTRDFYKKPEIGHFYYSRKLKKTPEFLHALENRHIMYRNQMALMDKLEKEGKAFVFAMSHSVDIGTFTKDAKKEWELYNLAIDDYDRRKADFQAFMESSH